MDEASHTSIIPIDTFDMQKHANHHHTHTHAHVNKIQNLGSPSRILFPDLIHRYMIVSGVFSDPFPQTVRPSVPLPAKILLTSNAIKLVSVLTARPSEQTSHMQGNVIYVLLSRSGLRPRQNKLPQTFFRGRNGVATSRGWRQRWGYASDASTVL